ncbi:MAG: ABC transporter permease [Gaiellaceae bacterium]
MNELAPSRLLPADAVRVGTVAFRTRRTRAVLSAVGVAIGVAAMVAVLGISASSKADLISTLDRLGTNILQVTGGQGLFRAGGQLPAEAPKMITRIGQVSEVSVVGNVSATVLRTNYVPSDQTGGISVQSVDPNLLTTLAGRLQTGTFLNAATARYPAVVLGAVAAQRLGIDRAGVLVYLGGHWFTVAGILEPLELAPDLDTAALIGLPVAQQLFAAGDSPATIYVRATPQSIDDVSSVLPATASPQNPEEVQVSRPSDALQARSAVNTSYTALFLGLGAVALLVDGIGIANMMVISVLERRSEIGLRRALGATKRHIWSQFLTESALLGFFGGLAGILIGVLVTAAYASSRGWAVVVPSYAVFGGLAAALLIGALAGLYPAVRAARMSPTEALRTV